MRNRFTTFFVAAAFFLTGGCALVYESLWTRYISELTGGTALSQLIVLMVFMGGLAVGAAWIGRLADQRQRQTLFIYGGLEIGIGIYALLFPYLHQMLTQLYYSMGKSLGGGTASLLILKVLLSFFLIITPSIAMGGTLPAVTRYLTKSLEGLRSNISLLYGINSLGAVVGILAGGFFLVYRYGMDASMQYTGFLNLLIGCAALAYALYSKTSHDTGAKNTMSACDQTDDIPDCHTYNPAEISTAIVTAGLSGFAAMALQVTWIRYFMITLGATHSSFTIVVAAFIFGIGLGSLLLKTKMAGRFHLPKILISLLLLITTTLWLELFLYARLPFEIGRILGVFAHTPFAWPFYSVTKFGILFLLMLSHTLASGMILPVCVRIAEQGAERIGRDVAKIYVVNTIAGLLGILVTGQVLFRVLNLPHTLQVIMLIYLGTTIFLALALHSAGRKRILAYTTVLLVVNLVFWDPWSPKQTFVSRVDFGYNTPVYYKDFLKYNENRVIVKDLHGPDAHVTVLDNTAEKQNYRSLFINGKPDAGTGSDLSINILLGHLPVLLHPAPENVFLLGLGSGITTGEILKHPDINSVVTAELAAEVFEASKAFADYNNRYWENPRHRLVIDDGMTYLRLSEEKFDVITLQPTNIWQAGMPGLFSEDFFRLIKSRLKPGGLAAQWLQTYMIDDRSVELVLKTFSSVFPNTSIFKLNENNILLIGYDGEWKFDPQSLVRRFNQPQILESQKRIGNANPAVILLREVVDQRSFHQHTNVLTMPVNTLNFPILEQAAEFGLFMQKSSTLLQKLDSRTDPDHGNMLFHKYAEKIGLSLDHNRALLDTGWIKDNPTLRNSLNLRLIDKLRSEDQPSSHLSALSYMYDSQLREIIMHPNYSKEPEQLTADDAYNMLGAELLVWHKAASQVWTPDLQRLHQLYERLASEVDRKTAGKVARNAGFSLALGRACKAAITFFRIAEVKEALDPEAMTSEEIGVVFNCEVLEGDVTKANRWWNVIQEKNITRTPAMKADKRTLDIKLGGDPPPIVYGRLPIRWQ